MPRTHLGFRTRRDKVVASVLGLAQLGAAIVALGGLGCGRTAGSAENRGSSGATPASPSASSPADGQSLGPVDPAAYAKACGATCKAHEPPPATTPPCYNVSVVECASQCQAGLVDLDAPCAECLVKEMTWPAAQGGCSETECVCSGGTPAFGGAPCSLACTSTRERQARERAASPEPESLGHQPIRTIDLGKRFVHALSASDRNGLWSVMTTPAKELVLAELSLEGSVLNEAPLPAELQREFRVYASSHGVLVFGKNELGAALARFDLNGAFVWSRAVDGEVSPVDAASEFGGNAELGSAIFSLRRGHDFAYIDADGAELETRSVPVAAAAEQRYVGGRERGEASPRRGTDDESTRGLELDCSISWHTRARVRPLRWV